MLHHSVRSFKHSGDRGDLIYALPVIRALGGGQLFLWDAPPDRCMLEDGSISLFTPAKIDSILPLILKQPYIRNASVWKGERFQYDFDVFRYHFDLRTTNLCDAQLQLFNVPVHEHANAWLAVDPIQTEQIVVARSPRYHNESINWREVYQFIRGRAVFVGHPNEHRAFQQVAGPLPYHATNNMLELAQVIAGAHIFLGNQSCPYAIAEGLKKTAILEVCRGCPNTIFQRRGALHLWGPVTEKELREWELDRA